MEPDGIAQLEGGEFRQQAAPGSATETVVRLAQVRSFGRIDNGSSIDAAPILTVDPGGSGTFIYLVAALNVDGHPEMAATTLLGDRVAVRSVRIVDSQIVVGMRVRGSDDPFAYLTTEVTRTYVLEGSELVLLSEETSTVPPPSPGDYGFTPERIEVNEAEKETVMGRLAPGELGDYVLEGEAGQELQVALRSQFSNAILSVYGLTYGEVLVSVTEFKARFTGILPSSQDYAIRVITLAGDELDYHLDVQLQRRSSTIPPLSSPTSPPPDTSTPTPEVVALATPTQSSPVSGVRPPLEGGLFVYLTFDDGPGAPFTGQVLDLLARFNAKGTFFVLGVNVQTMPEFTGETVAADEEPDFASRRMVFVELCPYASQRFNLPSLMVEELARSETGFQTAAEITAILLKEARPHLLLVNGASALANFHTLYRTRLAEWHERAYASASSGRKLWHCQGILRGLGHDLPMIGFPFLRTPRTHNSHAEIHQLGTAGREFVRSVSQSSEP